MYIGLHLEFYNSTGPLVYQTHWTSSNFTTLAPVLSLTNFPGEVVISESEFQDIKLAYNYTYSASKSYSEFISGSSSLAQRHFGIIQQSLILIDSAMKGIVIFNSHFSNCSTVSGLVSLNIATVFSKGVLLAHNTFSNSTSLI